MCFGMFCVGGNLVKMVMNDRTTEAFVLLLQVLIAFDARFSALVVLSPGQVMMVCA